MSINSTLAFSILAACHEKAESGISDGPSRSKNHVVQVELARGGSRRGGGGYGGGYGGGISRRSKYRVMVTGLPKQCSWQDLKDFMRKAGDVTFSNVSPSFHSSLGRLSR